MIKVDSDKFASVMSTKGDLFSPAEAVSHANWITDLVVSLVGCLSNGNDDGEEGDTVGPYGALVPLCKLQMDFCERLLPYAVHELLVRGCEEQVGKIISGQVANFFAKVFHRWWDNGGSAGSKSSLSQGTWRYKDGKSKELVS